eukprot:4708538-Alexandrium_andersonii.AAC.1
MFTRGIGCPAAARDEARSTCPTNKGQGCAENTTQPRRDARGIIATRWVNPMTIRFNHAGRRPAAQQK